MENIIFNELKIQGFNVDVGIITEYGANEKGHGVRRQLEIDFVCNKGSKRYYIQSAYAIPDPAKMGQEQRSLMLTGDFFKKIIITKDAPAPYYNDDGVLVMSVYFPIAQFSRLFSFNRCVGYECLRLPVE